MVFWSVCHQVVIMSLLALVGVILSKFKIVSHSTIKELSVILLKVVSPVIIIKNLMLPLNQEMVFMLGTCFVLSILSFVVGVFFSSIMLGKEAGLEKFSGEFSNAAFLGIPLVTGILGPKAVIYMIPYLKESLHHLLHP